MKRPIARCLEHRHQQPDSAGDMKARAADCVIRAAQCSMSWMSHDCWCRDGDTPDLGADVSVGKRLLKARRRVSRCRVLRFTSHRHSIEVPSWRRVGKASFAFAQHGFERPALFGRRLDDGLQHLPGRRLLLQQFGRSSVRWRSSLSRRAFSMAITACAAKFVDQLDLLFRETGGLPGGKCQYGRSGSLLLEHRHGE